MRTAIIATALLVLPACAAQSGASGDGPELPAPASEATTEVPSTSAPASDMLETNERGYLVKEIGEKAGWAGTPGDSDGAVTFALDKIVVDPPCHEYGQPPESGHTLLLHVRVATGNDRDTAMAAAGVLNPFNFAEVGKDGITRDADIGMCTDPQRGLSADYGINQKYAGTIEIVMPEANGSLILKDQSMTGPGGWEWSY